MKRKIKHDAINNQEDEDSSAYPLPLLNDGVSDKKEKESIGNSADYSSSEASNTKDETTK